MITLKVKRKDALPYLIYQRLVSAGNGANALTVVAVVVVPVGVARVEVEVVGVVRVVWVLRRRPVVAVLTSVVEVAVPAVASSGHSCQTCGSSLLILMVGGIPNKP